MPTPVAIPLLNPNEPEAMLTAIYVSVGQRVVAGQALCTLETTKSSADLEATADGFVVGLHFHQGQIVQAGETLCYLAEDPTWTPPESESVISEGVEGELGLQGGYPIPEKLRITQPALALARQLGLNLTELPTDQLITESMIRLLQGNQVTAQAAFFPSKDESIRAQIPLTAQLATPADDTAIIVYGGGGHGKTLIDLLRGLGAYHIIGVVDDGLQVGEMIMDLPVLGGAGTLVQLRAQGVGLAVNAVGGIGNLATRIEVFRKLAEAGFVCLTVVHPSAVVESSAALSMGVQVLAHAYVGSEARIGFGCIVNTGAVVSHDCLLGDYANISPGAMLAGETNIGAGALVGMGATINLRVVVGAGARIGNGATVKEDVPENGIVRAGTTWP